MDRILERLIEFDKALFTLINGVHSDAFDSIMVAVSGTMLWLPLYAFLMIVLFLEKRWKGLITMLFIAVLITLCDQVSVHGFKEVFLRLRPCHDPDMYGMVHIVDDHCGGLYGFVSSHATNVFGLAVFYLAVVQKFRKVLAFLLIFWAILVSYSRIYLGVHYPADIVGGAILGSGLALSLAWMHQKLMVWLPGRKK